MNILLITDSYPPEIRSASHLMQEMAEGLRDRGHKVSVVTSYPQYNLVPEIKKIRFNKFSVEDNIEVIRIKTLPHHKVNLILRGVSQLTLPYIFFYNIKKYIKHKIDIVIVYSPPLPLAIAGGMIKAAYGAKFILNVQDIFPQNAMDLGALNNKLMIKFFEWMETKAYKIASKIAVHSHGNRKFLTGKKQVPVDKIHVMHNWIDLKPYMNTTNTNVSRERYGLNGKFLLLFAGVIGPSQGLDLVIKAANELKEIQDICFLLVGDGTEKERLRRMAKSYSLRNVIFKPFVSKEEYPNLVKSSDIGMVCLSSKNKTPVVPGKILGYMAASIPVVAFLNKESDAHVLIKDARCGYSTIHNGHKGIAETIGMIYRERDKLKEYGENGFKYVSEHFSKDVCIDNLEELF
jgi:glycosyltransferase involved in cell wall biosynthesis